MNKKTNNFISFYSSCIDISFGILISLGESLKTVKSIKMPCFDHKPTNHCCPSHAEPTYVDSIEKQCPSLSTCGSQFVKLDCMRVAINNLPNWSFVVYVGAIYFT